MPWLLLEQCTYKLSTVNQKLRCLFQRYVWWVRWVMSILDKAPRDVYGIMFRENLRVKFT